MEMIMNGHSTWTRPRTTLPALYMSGSGSETSPAHSSAVLTMPRGPRITIQP